MSNSGLQGFPRPGLRPPFFNQANGVSRPWVSKMRELSPSIADYGGVPDGVTDNSVAVAKTYAEVKRRGGGILSIPEGNWGTSSFPAVDGNGVIIQGAGFASRITDLSLTGDLITVTGQHNQVRDLYFKPGVRKTAGAQLVFTGNCFECAAGNLRVDMAWNGILARNVTQLYAERIHLRQLLGTNGVQFDGTLAGVGSFGATFNHIDADNPYPVALAALKTWAQTTAFALGDFILQGNGFVYQCTTAGTSAGIGTGPTGLPAGTTPDSAFTNTIADGSCQWKFVCNSLAWFTMQNYASSLRLNNCALINGFFGFAMDDAAATGTSFPQWADINNLEVDHPLGQGVFLVRGAGFDAVNSWWGSALNAQGMDVAGTYKGNVSVRNTRIAANRFNGAVVRAGPKNCHFSGNRFQHNSIGGSGTFHGLAFDAGATDFTAQGNQAGPDPAIGGGNLQGYGIIVVTGASDRYIVADNLVSGNVTGGVFDGGSGVNKRVANNY